MVVVLKTLSNRVVESPEETLLTQVEGVEKPKGQRWDERYPPGMGTNVVGPQRENNSHQRDGPTFKEE